MKTSSDVPDVQALAALQLLWTSEWHHTPPALPHSSGLIPLLQQEHRANFALWHEEDKARDPSATDTRIAAVKRAIDTLNQQRNDLVEQIDEWLLQHLPIPAPTAKPHSETPGMMFDRLSILALKLFHTREESERRDASSEHRDRNAQRLFILNEQRSDLALALATLLAEIAAGKKSFKLYRQMKMYNDPDLNPQVYGKRRG